MPVSVTDSDLHAAIAELLVHFDVYRAYPGDPASDQRIDAAFTRARSNTPELATALAVLEPLLRREVPAAEAFAVRFEQTTGPVMAKGVEDTAFYRYLRLTALNEVGGDPGHFGMTCRGLARQLRSAGKLTGRGHDHAVDPRHQALRGCPRAAARPRGASRRVDGRGRRWRRRARLRRRRRRVPVLADLRRRVADRRRTVQAYVEKATREAKRAPSWTDPDDSYDQRWPRTSTACSATTADGRCRRVRRAAARARLVEPLAQKLVQLTMPGVPDVYQGHELPDLSLVDPDNRRPVDYDGRRRRLAELDAAGAAGRRR